MEDPPGQPSQSANISGKGGSGGHVTFNVGGLGGTGTGSVVEVIIETPKDQTAVLLDGGLSILELEPSNPAVPADFSIREKELLLERRGGGGNGAMGGEGGEGVDGEPRVRFGSASIVLVDRDQAIEPLDEELNTIEERRRDRAGAVLNDVVAPAHRPTQQQHPATTVSFQEDEPAASEEDSHSIVSSSRGHSHSMVTAEDIVVDIRPDDAGVPHETEQPIEPTQTIEVPLPSSLVQVHVHPIHASPISSTTAVPPSETATASSSDLPTPHHQHHHHTPSSRRSSGFRAASDLSLRELELLEEHHTPHDAEGTSLDSADREAARASSSTGGQQAAPAVDMTEPDVEIELQLHDTSSSSSSSSSSEEEDESRLPAFDRVPPSPRDPTQPHRPRSLSAASASRVTFSPLPAVVAIPKDQPHLHVLRSGEGEAVGSEEDGNGNGEGSNGEKVTRTLSDISGKEYELLQERGVEEESKVTFSSTPATVRIPKTQPVVSIDLARIRERSSSSSRASVRSSSEVLSPLDPIPAQSPFRETFEEEEEEEEQEIGGEAREKGDEPPRSAEVAHFGSHWASDLSLREVSMLESKLAESGIQDDNGEEKGEDWEDEEGEEEQEREEERKRADVGGRSSRASLTPSLSGGFAKVTFSPRPAVVTISKDQPTIPLSLPTSLLPPTGPPERVPVVQARLMADQGTIEVVGVEEEGVGRDLSGKEVELLSAKLSERDEEEEEEEEEEEGEEVETDDEDEEGSDESEDDGDGGDGGAGVGGAGAGAGTGTGNGNQGEDYSGNNGGQQGNTSTHNDNNNNNSNNQPSGARPSPPKDATDQPSSSSDEEQPHWTPSTSAARRASAWSVDNRSDNSDSTDPESPAVSISAIPPAYIPLQDGSDSATLVPAPRSRSTSPASLLARLPIHRVPSAQKLAGALAAGFSSISSVVSVASSTVFGSSAAQLQQYPHVLSAPTMEAFASYLGNFKGKPRIVVLTGAGISTNAGLSDFRSAGTGIYARFEEWKTRIQVPYPEAVFNLEYFRSDPKPFYTMMRDLFVSHDGRRILGVPSPTKAHWFIRLLYEKGMLLRNYTQNIDSLEHLSGLPANLVVESHGHFRGARCAGRSSSGGGAIPEVIPPCGQTFDVDFIRRKLEEHPWEVPMCEHCGGWVKPDLTFFGETLPPLFWEDLRSDFENIDVLIVMGTSLQVQPFASLIDRVPPHVPRLMINRDPPKTGPFRRAARRLNLWLDRSRSGQDPIDVLREDDSDTDYDLVHDNAGTLRRHQGGHADAFGQLVRDFDFAMDEETGADAAKSGRDPAKAKMRDAIHLGDADDAVEELCRLLGWTEDLATVQAEGEARFESFKEEQGDGGWWSVFAYPDTVEENFGASLGTNSTSSDLLSPTSPFADERKQQEKKSFRNDMWNRMQSRFGIETPRNCEFM